MLIYALILPVALTLPKKMGFLSMFSTFSIFCLIVFVVVLIWKCSVLLSTNGINPTAKTFDMNLHFFNALAIYSLMFVKHANPRIKARSRIIGTSFFTCFLFVLIPGVMGYLTFGAHTDDIILNNFPNVDIAIQIVRV